MPIELTCTRCGQILRVPDEAAGKKARCPECENVFPVPPASAGHPEPGLGGDNWLVRIEDGRQFGPVPKAELDQWVAEGRITGQTELFREGGQGWQPAASVYSGLAPTLPATTAQPVNNPFRDDPYASPAATGAFGPGSYIQANRSGLILTLGILSLFLTSCTCFVLGIMTWVMGQNDLRAMRNGTMDPSGYGTTQAGMILGGIATFLHGLWFLFVMAANA